MSSKALPVAAGEDWPAVADEYGQLDNDLDRDLAPFQPLIKRRDELRKKLQTKFAEADATKSFTVEGAESWDVIVDARRNEAVIKDKPKLLRRLGASVYHALCKISQTDLKETDLNAEEISKFVTYEQTGWRPVKAVHK